MGENCIDLLTRNPFFSPYKRTQTIKWGQCGSRLWRSFGYDGDFADVNLQNVLCWYVKSANRPANNHLSGSKGTFGSNSWNINELRSKSNVFNNGFLDKDGTATHIKKRKCSIKKALTHWHKMETFWNVILFQTVGDSHSQSKSVMKTDDPESIRAAPTVSDVTLKVFLQHGTSPPSRDESISERHYVAGIFLDDDSSSWHSDLFQKWWDADVFHVTAWRNITLEGFCASSTR